MQMQTHIHTCTHAGAVFVTYGNDGAVWGAVAGGHSDCSAFCDTLRREFC